MVEKLIDSFEELKKYIFVITRKNKPDIVVRFKNDNFYHLVGLHKIKNFDNYFPSKIIAKDKKYKYIKKNPEKFNNILKNQIKEKDLLKLRIETFPNIIDLMKGNDTNLYNLKTKTVGSLYNGDYGLKKMYDHNVCCLLGLQVTDKSKNNINCFPNSWMANKNNNNLVKCKRPIYMENIVAVQIEYYNKMFNTIIV